MAMARKASRVPAGIALRPRTTPLIAFDPLWRNWISARAGFVYCAIGRVPQHAQRSFGKGEIGEPCCRQNEAASVSRTESGSTGLNWMP